MRDEAESDVAAVERERLETTQLAMDASAKLHDAQTTQREQEKKRLEERLLRQKPKLTAEERTSRKALRKQNSLLDGYSDEYDECDDDDANEDEKMPRTIVSHPLIANAGDIQPLQQPENAATTAIGDATAAATDPSPNKSSSRKGGISKKKGKRAAQDLSGILDPNLNDEYDECDDDVEGGDDGDNEKENKKVVIVHPADNAVNVDKADNAVVEPPHQQPITITEEDATSTVAAVASVAAGTEKLIE